MANNKMLIDATHPEETRVVVLRNGRVEEFDYESAARKQLRGNIYLAKVTRVEPSLQAAFVDYGGNRHGFLAFNEIHPDYYQIPVADRQALLDEEAAAEAEEEAAADARAERLARRRQRDPGGQRPAEVQSADEDGHYEVAEGGTVEMVEDRDEDDEDDEGGEDEAPVTLAEAAGVQDDAVREDVPDEVVDARELTAETVRSGGEDAALQSVDGDAERDVGDRAPSGEANSGEDGGVQVVATSATEAEAVEQVGSEDALEELPSRQRRRPRSYKIQEVIKRRQVILVQVVKEERGNKGAALTTYLSLAGRYTVLMPNTARGGGISRKITNPQDRKRLKAIAQELEVPEGMGLIIRTAGAARTKQEIKRDFEYLLRLWESVRDLTLESTAPSLVYEEGNLIKRSIRDLYNKDVEEVIVAGDQAHREAKDFMRMLMPSHAKNVLQHQDPEPLFTKYGIERQLNAMFSPYVTLKSGGYLVINQTEALVAIDVNSGKATREFSIEETALNTNLEASDEIARQLKLRDLAGLVVIDFIDMEEKRNNRAVERRLKDALRFDRARIQLGRISHFGLMEMSRQRLRTGVLEGSTSQCPHCQGTGIIRSTESVALAVLRGLEDALMAGARTSLVATTTHQVALYILNNKRQFINEMEARHGIFIAVQASDKFQGANFQIEKGQAAPVQVRRPDRAAVNMDWGFDGEGEGESDNEVQEGEGVTFVEESDEGDEADRPSQDARGRENGHREGGGREEGGRRRRRRRGRRGGSSGEGRQDDRRSEGNGHVAVRPLDHDAPQGDDVDRSAGDWDSESEIEEVGGSDEGDDRATSAHGGDHRNGNGRQEEGGSRRRRRGRRGGRRGRDRNRLPLGQEPNGQGGGVGDQPGFEGAANGGDEFRSDIEADDIARGVGDGVSREAPRTVQSAEALVSDERGPKRVEEPAKPARARRTEPVVSVPETAQVVASQPVPVLGEEPPPRSRSRSVATSSEPRLERVVLTPDQAAIEAAANSGAAQGQSEPTRRGWWQRRLGG